MVKIERDGRKRYIKCFSCNNVLSFEKEDECYQEGETWEGRYIICPCCKSKVVTYESYKDEYFYSCNHSKAQIKDVE